MTITEEKLSELLREAAKAGAEIALEKMKPKPSDWLSSREVMAMLNVGRSTLWRYETRDVLQTNGKDGHQKRFSRKYVEDFIAGKYGRK